MLAVAPDYAVMLLSYELTAAELMEWSRLLTPADEAEWVRRGGIIDP